MDQRKNMLLENKPILFKKKWNKEIDDLDNEIHKIYEKIGLELEDIEKSQDAINQN